MDHDRRLREEGLENEPALGGGDLLWGYDDVRDEPALVSRPDGRDLPQGAIGDEPALDGADGLATYATLYRERRAAARPLHQGLALGLIATGMIPLPLVGLFVLSAGGGAVFRAIAATVLLPLLLEVLKPVVALAVVEGRPWLVPDRGTLIGAHVLGGLGFGVVLYGLVALGPLLVGLSYSPGRLAAAMLLHAVTALVSGIGVARVWQEAHVAGTRPQLRGVIGWLGGAVAIHAAYGAVVLVLADSSWAF